MRNSKLVRKIWLTSFMIWITFIAIAILNFNIIITLLPIIIPSTILTFGMPPYFIIKQAMNDIKIKKQKTEKLGQQEEINFKQNKQRIKEKIEFIKKENFYEESQKIEPEHTQGKVKIIKKGTR